MSQIITNDIQGSFKCTVSLYKTYNNDISILLRSKRKAEKPHIRETETSKCFKMMQIDRLLSPDPISYCCLSSFPFL